jgi:hypothetical protein
VQDGHRPVEVANSRARHQVLVYALRNTA